MSLHHRFTLSTLILFSLGSSIFFACSQAESFANTTVSAKVGAFGNDFILTSDDTAAEEYTVKATPNFQGIAVDADPGTTLVATGPECSDTSGGKGEKVVCTLLLDSASVLSATGSNLNDDTITLAGQFPAMTIGVEGKDGNDTINVATLESGDISLNGGLGDDTITSGTKGSFTLIGGSNTDTLIGGDGNDTFQANSTADGDDTIKQTGKGADCVSYEKRTTRVFVRATGDPESGDKAAGENDSIAKETPCLIGGKGDDLLELSQTEVGLANTKISGGDGNDTLAGSQAADTLIGGQDNDSLNGAAGDDILQGGIGEDTLHGNAGNDQLDGGDDNDRLFGEEDNDKLNGGDGNDDLRGEDGNDELKASYVTMAGDGSDTYNGGTDNDTVSFTNYPKGTSLNLSPNDKNDDGLPGEADGISSSVENLSTEESLSDTTVTGSAKDNQISTGGGDDIVDAGEGNDVISGGDGTNTLHGELGNDTFKQSTGTNTFDGGDGRRDTVDYSLSPSGVHVTIDDVADDGITGGHDDVQRTVEAVIGSEFADTINNPQPTIAYLTGNGGDDIIEGGTFIDTIEGGPGNDTLRGNGADDKLYGGEGNDDLDGGTQDDFLEGQAGNDTLRSGSDGMDDLTGGDGTDSLTYAQSTSKVSVTLDEQQNDGVANEKDTVHSDIEQVTGSRFDDTLIGDGNNNALNGGDGNDQLNGGLGVDSLSGEAGNDTILARDDIADQILCGSEFDVTNEDQIDQVSDDCEQTTFQRKVVEPPPPPPTSPTTTTPQPPPPPKRVCTVPKLLGKKAKQARALIRKAGLKSAKSKLKRTKSKRKVGRVIAQSPKAGKKVRCGSTIRVTLGKKNTRRKR